MNRAPCLLLLVLVLSSACNALQWHKNRLEEKYADHGLEPSLVELPSGTMHIYRGGNGSPLLLIHGFGIAALSTWENQVGAFAGEHLIIAPDLYWFGKSKPNDPAFVGLASEQAATLIELLDKLNIEQVQVVGVSFGGHTSLELARKYPERVSKLVLVDAAGLTPTADERREMRANFGNPERWAEVLLPRTGEGLDALWDKMLYEPKWIPGFLLDQIVEQTYDPHRAEKTRILDRMSERKRLGEEELGSIAAPTLVVWGEHDPLFPPSMGKRMAKALPNGELVLFEECGHAPMLEKPGLFNETIGEFLSR
jgi:pimeloyl-ACP methyl ester carboxylesterase